MTEASSTANDTQRNHPVIGWLLMPLSLFPLFALLTYDWRAIPFLQSPSAPHTNWIGALGDWFAYIGYMTIGLAVWILPVACVLFGLGLVIGRRPKGFRRPAWFMLLLISAACLLQIAAVHAPGIRSLLAHINLSDAGGIIGYLIATRFLSPLISDFGASITMIILLVITLVALIGVDSIVSAVRSVFLWVTARDEGFPAANADDLPDDQREAYLAAMQARADAKAQAKAEKDRIKAEKLAAKAAREAEKEAAREAIRAAREAAKAARNAPAGQPVPPAAPIAVPPVRRPPAPAAPTAAEPEERGPYILPPTSLLAPLKASTADHSDVGEMSQRLLSTLKIFGIDATLSYTVQGPVVTKYAIELAPGTRYSVVTNLTDNLKGALHAKSIRIEAPIPGEDRIGIEVPNLKPAGITFREIFESEAWKTSEAELPLLFGKRADGKELVADLASMPHMLVAGATGQGKSVCLNSLINGLLMTRTPEQLKLIMVDPKCVEFTPYASIPHLLVPVITDNRKVVFSLHWAVAEMEKRLKLFARANVKNIYAFNHRQTLMQTDMFGNDESVSPDMPRTIPYIVIIIDEAADLIGQCGRDVNPDIQRITQKARAAGIHLILATQRPDAKIITGAIKANIPGRVAFKTSSAVDSRTILDEAGAENLIGKGDMLYRGKDGLLIRAQGAWISDDEITNITSFIQQHSNTQFDEKFATKLGRVKEAAIDDPFASNEDDPDNQPSPETSSAGNREQVKAAANADDFKKAIECIINTHRASTSHFQRQMGWGYNHAAKILDMLEAKGVVSPQAGMGPRQITMDNDQLMAILNGNGDDVAAEASADGIETDISESNDILTEGQQT